MIPKLVLWLLPVLFVIHDGEEALWLMPWLDRNRPRLERRFPRLAGRLYAHFSHLSRRAFTAMAAEELLLLSVVTLYSALTGNYYPWLALLLAFGLHLLVHLAQGVAVWGYVPSLATSVLCLPVVGWMLLTTINSRLFTGREFVFCAAAGLLVAGGNLIALHAFTARLRH